jgi:hypothetical protein
MSSKCGLDAIQLSLGGWNSSIFPLPWQLQASRSKALGLQFFCWEHRCIGYLKEKRTIYINTQVMLSTSWRFFATIHLIFHLPFLLLPALTFGLRFLQVAG